MHEAKLSAPGHHPNTSSNGFLTGLLMSTNKASSCRNTTSPHDILNFCPTRSSNVLPGPETLFPPQGTRQRGRQNKRQRTLQLRKCKITATAPATRCFHCMICPQGLAIIIFTLKVLPFQTQTCLCMDIVLKSKFARRFWFTRST